MSSILAALRTRAKSFLQHPVAMNLLRRSKKAKPLKKLWTNLNASTTDFAAMELCNQFKRVFEVMDENGDGKISPSELSQVLMCLGYDKSIASTEAEGMVRELDCDGDGFVDLDEFMDAVFNSYDVHSDEKSSCVDAEEGYDHLMDAFLVFDADKNGKISAKELRRVLVKLGCDKCSIGECRRMIKGVDKDGDGFVDFEDFRLMMTKKR